MTAEIITDIGSVTFVKEVTTLLRIVITKTMRGILDSHEIEKDGHKHLIGIGFIEHIVRKGTKTLSSTILLEDSHKITTQVGKDLTAGTVTTNLLTPIGTHKID